MKSFAKSWITTIIGLVGAVAVVIYPLLEGGAIDITTIGKAALIAAFGFFAKDANKTGDPK